MASRDRTPVEDVTSEAPPMVDPTPAPAAPLDPVHPYQRVSTYMDGGLWGWHGFDHLGAVVHDSGAKFDSEGDAITDARSGQVGPSTEFPGFVRLRSGEWVDPQAPVEE